MATSSVVSAADSAAAASDVTYATMDDGSETLAMDEAARLGK